MGTVNLCAQKGKITFHDRIRCKVITSVGDDRQILWDMTFNLISLSINKCYSAILSAINYLLKHFQSKLLKIIMRDRIYILETL